MTQNILLSAEPTRFDFKTRAGSSILATYLSLGSITAFPAKQMIITSTVNQDLIFSFDLTLADELRIPAGNTVPQTLIIDLRASNAALPQNTQILVRGAAAAASGQVSITLIG